MIIIISLNERLIGFSQSYIRVLAYFMNVLYPFKLVYYIANSSIRIVYSEREVKTKCKRLGFTMYTYRSLHESLLSITGVWCTDFVLAARERSFLRYR